MKTEIQMLMNSISVIHNNISFRDEYSPEDVSDKERELFKVIDFVYDLLTRCSIVSEIRVQNPPELREDNEPDTVQMFPQTADLSTDICFSILTGNPNPEINLRVLFQIALSKTRKTQADVCRELGFSAANISNYLNGKGNLSTKNYENAVNWLLFNLKTKPGPDQ